MRWLVAAGGTGGHIFPALSVASVFREKVKTGKVLFVGTSRGMESRWISARGFRLRTVKVYGLVGLSWRRRVHTLLLLPWTLIQCLAVLAAFRPHLVLGMGGYAAGPVVLLAALLRIRTAIAEQNAVAGRTNRILGQFALRVFVSFRKAADAFPAHKVRITGNPVRPELLERLRRVKPRHWEGTTNASFHLLIFGGSQGARGINLIVMNALAWLAEFPFPLEVVHQSGQKQLSELRAAYATKDIAHRIITFIENMDEAYEWAHLIVCRAGATSLSEVALFGKPAVLIPYPYAADDHQVHNARVFESAGAAVLLKEEGLTGQRLSETIEALAGNPERLRSMGENARSLARPDAAERIVDECMRLVCKEARHG